MLKNIENGLVSTGLPVQDQGSGGSFLPSDSSSLDEIGKLTQIHDSTSSDPMLSELEQNQPQLIAASTPAKDGTDELTGQDVDSSVAYLSDLGWIDASNGWGTVEKDSSNGDKKSGDGETITLDGKSYDKGLGVHSGSEISYKLDGNYTSFRSDIGIDDEVGDKGSAKFEVWADGDKLFASDTMKGDSSTEQVDVDVSGKQELKLVVADGGDGSDFDHASWGDAQLTKAEGGQELSSEPDSNPNDPSSLDKPTKNEDDSDDRDNSSVPQLKIPDGEDITVVPNPVPEPDPKPEPTPPPSNGSGEQARSADSFVDSIGVAIHLKYSGPYANFDSVVKPRLEELGVRHIRDGGTGSDFQKKLNDLAKSGIKSTLVADPRDGTTPQNVVDFLKGVPNSVEAVEGPNEWDIHPELKYNGKSFPEGLKEYQNGLFKAINGDPATKDIDVAAPSMAHSKNGSELGRLDSIDLGNMHSYQGGQRPTNGLESSWIPNTKKVSGDKPIIVSETGWHNSKDPSGQPGVSEKAEAKYTPRLYLEYFNNPDIERTFRYEFMNVREGKDRQENWGLLDADGSPQPAYNSLKNLIELTEDPNGAKGFTPGKLDYKLSGDTEDVNHTLLQKSDGEFNLILWQDAQSYDTKAKKDISVADNKVTLELGDTFKNATTYLSNDSTKATDNYSNVKSIDLSIPDHPLVVKLS